MYNEYATTSALIQRINELEERVALLQLLVNGLIVLNDLKVPDMSANLPPDDWKKRMDVLQIVVKDMVANYPDGKE